MIINFKSGFPYKIQFRLKKTTEGRSGDLIYNRRASRKLRVLLRLNTYLNLLEKSLLDQYEYGYVIVLNPKEYFDSKTKERKESLHKSVILGKNALVYYQVNDDDWIKFPIKKDWNQVVENTSDIDDWTGEFAVNITNGKKKMSFITRKSQGKNAIDFDWMTPELKNVSDRVQNNRFPSLGGKGLGNYDYDYCNEESLEHVCYQLSYLIWHIEGMREYLCKVSKIDNNLWKKKDKVIPDYQKIEKNVNYLTDCKNNVELYCEKNNLSELDILVRNKILDVNRNTTCPLCKVKILPSEILKTVAQDEGRENMQNTVTEIVLMHIEPLFPGKINHKPYNLGFGHHKCNTIQGNDSIKDTIHALEKIVNNYYSE